MPRTLSLTVREAANADHTGEVPIVLVVIDHDDLDAPIRLSSDPTERLSIDPLRYGTVHDGEEYEFVLMSAIVPDDVEDKPASVSLSFENVVADMASIIRAVRSPPTVTLRTVLASAPDDIEIEYTGLMGIRGSYDPSSVTLDASREPISAEPWPGQHMTQHRFPGLFG